MDVVVLGRLLGTASGWALIDDDHIQFYDFDPAPGFAELLEPRKAIAVNFEYGLLEEYDAEKLVASRDVVHLLTGTERTERS